MKSVITVTHDGITTRIVAPDPVVAQATCKALAAHGFVHTVTHGPEPWRDVSEKLRALDIVLQVVAQP